MATLVYSDADGVDRSFALGSEVVLVGRGDECSIKSTDPRVSRQHARFYVDGGVLWIEDLGSSTGTFVGPNKVQRAPVPTGEIILVGSLVMRLLPTSGTLPPPVGLHGTLAVLLDMERKTRSAVEEERDAFAKRVGELHQELRAAQDKNTLPPLRGGEFAGEAATAEMRPDQTAPAMMSEAIRLRDESEAKVAVLERTLAAQQDELQVLRNSAGPNAEWSSKGGVDVDKLKGELDEAQAARSIAEHAAGEAQRDAVSLRDELDGLKRQSVADLEAMRLELMQLREAQKVADTAAGMQVAEKLAEADIVILGLQRELEIAKQNVRASSSNLPDARVRELTELNAVITGRAEKAEKDLASAQIRSQGAERNLAHANAQAAKAETRANLLEGKVNEAESKAKLAASELESAKERITTLEVRVSGSPVQALEARATKLAADVEELSAKLAGATAKLTELQTAVTESEQQARDADERAITAATELASAQSLLAEAEEHSRSLQARVAELSGADSAIAEAAKAQQTANARATAADAQVAESTKRAEDAEKRASAADTMAKAMAKDVAEALRRAADADMRARTVTRELENAHRRADNAEAIGADVASSVKESQLRASAAEIKIDELTKTLDARVAELEAARTEAVASATAKHAAELAAASAKHTAELEAAVAKHTSELAELQQRLETAGKSSVAKLEVTQKELQSKLEAAQRELAAERTSSQKLVDRKTQLERDLADARKTAEELAQVDAKLVERENEIESLSDRILDLESGIAVAETAQQASLAEARAEIAKLKARLGEAEPAVAKAQQIAADLGVRVSNLETQLAEAVAARSSAETALAAARLAVAELEREREERAADLTMQDRLDDATARAEEAERKLDGLEARAEAADLAIGRAGALQRQLDEAIQKLTWLEREAHSKSRDSARQLEQSEAIINDRIAAAEARQREAEARVKDADGRVAEAERRTQLAEDRNDELAAEVHSTSESAHASIEQSRIAVEQHRVAAEQARVALAELQHRLEDAEARAADAHARLDHAEQSGGNVDELRTKLAHALQRIATLEREVASADNVRSFAAETEREIAQLQRDLRETRSKLTQMTLERDRLELEVRDSRSDSETTNQRAPLDAREVAHIEAQQRRTSKGQAVTDPEDTANFDMARFEQMVVQAEALETKLAGFERDNKLLKERLADTEQKLRNAIDGDDDDSNVTRTGSGVPVDMVEHVSIIEESIDSLRANMRAASDETAVMEQSDSVVAVASAVSQAAEHIERARAAIKALARSVGLES